MTQKKIAQTEDESTLNAGSGDDNPKVHPTSNAEKDPDDWVTGEEPMTGAQARTSRRCVKKQKRRSTAR